MEKIRNLSIRKTIILYMFLNLIVSFLLSAVIVWAADRTQQSIWWKYVDQEKYFQAVQEADDFFYGTIPRASHSEMTAADRHLSELCDFLQTYSILLISGAGTVITVVLFYRNKLKKPLNELEHASLLISQNNLDFAVTYENQDEMGQLCREFEKMRAALAENNRQLWKIIEQEKALRSAIAHDIRSPLSILKGYQEMLLEFIPEGAIDQDKLLEMLTEGMHQIGRMEAFIETMRRLTSLEERKINPQEVTIRGFAERIRQDTAVLEKSYGKVCIVMSDTDRETVRFDSEVVLEVVDNLISNAMRYARKEIEVGIEIKGDELYISVQDDGMGFTEEKERLTKAFYHANPQDDLQHFGLGLYICRLYCEKHGGRLLLKNGECGGANAVAVFRLV